MNSVIQQPSILNTGPRSADLIIGIASVADDIPTWGSYPASRDVMLRQFWPTENVLAGAMYSTTSKYSAFGWRLLGPARTVAQVQRMLHGVEFGEGWIALMVKTLIDLFSQDNGAFIEVIRTADSDTAPVVSLNHLEANRCVRTGVRSTPVIYYDALGRGHEMKWYQVMTLEEFPSPIEEMRGMQYCAVTRVLRAAQILRDISIYKREKISGRFTKSVYLVSGVQQQTITDSINLAQSQASSMGLQRYIQPVIVASLDPTAQVSMEKIDLASLPEGFDEEDAMRWYINQMALGFGSDYQDFAPLPAGNLGTSQQSKLLHVKSQGKGSKLFMSLVEHKFNFHGIMPDTVTFKFGEQDVSEDSDMAKLRNQRAQTRKIQIESGEITAEVARQMAVDAGDLDPRYLEQLNSADLTPDITLDSGNRL